MPILDTSKQLVVEFPQKLMPLLQAPGDYNVLDGGRGSGKSWSVARHFVIESAWRSLRYLCTREMQNSIRDSVHRLLADQIHMLGLQHLFEIQRDGIYSRAGSEFLFKGLRHNTSEIKSTEGIDRCWVEEAEKVSMDSWDTLLPTIRKPGAQFWIVFNPEEEKSATYQKFVKNSPPGTKRVQLNFMDNPWFSEVLRRKLS